MVYSSWRLSLGICPVNPSNRRLIQSETVSRPSIAGLSIAHLLRLSFDFPTTRRAEDSVNRRGQLALVVIETLRFTLNFFSNVELQPN